MAVPSRRHAKAKLGLPDQVPGSQARIRPTSGVPVIDGATLLAGGGTNSNAPASQLPCRSAPRWSDTLLPSMSAHRRMGIASSAAFGGASDIVGVGPPLSARAPTATGVDGWLWVMWSSLLGVSQVASRMKLKPSVIGEVLLHS